MKCFRCNFVPFFLQTSLKVGNSTGSSLSHFALLNAPHILYWRQVGTAGRPVKYPYPLPPQPGLCNVCRMWFCIVLLKYAWTSLETMSSWRQHIVCNEIQVKVNLEITTLFFYLRFPYCPNFFWFGVVAWDVAKMATKSTWRPPCLKELGTKLFHWFSLLPWA